MASFEIVAVDLDSKTVKLRAQTEEDCLGFASTIGARIRMRREDCAAVQTEAEKDGRIAELEAALEARTLAATERTKEASSFLHTIYRLGQRLAEAEAITNQAMTVGLAYCDTLREEVEIWYGRATSAESEARTECERLRAKLHEANTLDLEINSALINQRDELRANLEAKSAECERLRGEVGEAQEVAERNAADCAHLRQSAKELEAERDTLRVWLDQFQGRAVPSFSYALYDGPRFASGKDHYVTKADGVRFGPLYEDHGCVKTFIDELNEWFTANWPTARTTAAPVEKPTREEATAWAKEGAPSPSVLAWSEMHRGPLDRGEAEVQARDWMMANNIRLRLAPGNAWDSLADLLQRIADQARRAAIEDAAQVTATMPVVARIGAFEPAATASLLHEVANRIRALATPKETT